MPFYNISEKMIFFAHIPKTAGSSIEAQLRRFGYEGLNDFCFDESQEDFSKCSAQHFHHAIIDRLFRKDFVHFSFTVVRHPLKRLISEFKYRWKMRREEQLNFTNHPNEPNEFNDWVEYALKGFEKDRYIFDNHIRPQHTFVGKNTTVFKLEDGLEPVFVHLSKICEVSIDLPGERSLMSGNAVVLPSDKTIQRICDFYARDFSEFSYDPSVI